MLSPPDSTLGVGPPALRDVKDDAEPSTSVPTGRDVPLQSTEPAALLTPPPSHATSSHKSPEPFSDSDTDADDDLEAPSWDGIRRRKRKHGNKGECHVVPPACSLC
jgi:hypothetical protein